MTRLTLTLTLLLTACGSSAEPEAPAAPAPVVKHDGGEMKHEMPAGEAKYACPMHPDITSHEPADCSKCGMALVKQDEHDHASHDHGDGAHNEADDHGH
jgi:Cu(I)/Ag(I) efflux system membrane fusion protein